MLLIPAIDIKDGACVRLEQGKMDKVTVFSNDPVQVALQWIEYGCKRIHLVDLNGALTGKSVNRKIISAILKANDGEVTVQIGGGIRTLEAIEAYLDMGADFVVIGTAAIKSPGFLQDACVAFGGHIIVALDAKDRRIATDGWAKLTGHDVIEFAQKLENYGVSSIIYTDIGRDGMLTGINLDATVQLAESCSIPIIASGGLSSLDDIRKVHAQQNVGIEGLICGRSIYNGDIDFAQALALVDQLDNA